MPGAASGLAAHVLAQVFPILPIFSLDIVTASVL